MQTWHNARRIVVKVGTSTLTYDTGHINIRSLERLVAVISDLQNAGRQMVLVTSAAIGVGRSKLRLAARPKDTPSRQAAAAVGQCELMHLYDTAFVRHGQIVAQLLLTRDVTENPVLRRNAGNTFEKLFEMGVIPIVNENDSVATDELEGESYGDNDTLSAVVAALVDADLLVLLSDIDGLYTADPRKDPGARLISTVDKIDDAMWAMAAGVSSNRGTGGMTTKLQAATIAGKHGIDMAILNGQNPDLLYELLEKGGVGTIFKSAKN